MAAGREILGDEDNPERTKSDIWNAGSEAVVKDPKLLYEVTRRLYQNGDFDVDMAGEEGGFRVLTRKGGYDDNAIGKQYAYEFLTAAQKYAPEHFGANDIPTKFEPPVFPETAEDNPFMVPEGNQSPALSGSPK